MQKLIIISIVCVLITTLFVSCAATKQKTALASNESSITQFSRIDSLNLVKVTIDHLKASVKIADNSKYKITYYSEKTDSSGKQIVDRVEEKENNIITSSFSENDIHKNVLIKKKSGIKYKINNKLQKSEKSEVYKKSSHWPYYIVLLIIAIVLYIFSKKIK